VTNHSLDVVTVTSDLLTPQVETLTKPELLFLLARFCPRIDARDVANARWEMANEAATRAFDKAELAERAEIAAIKALAADPGNRRLAKDRARKSLVAIEAREAADRLRAAEKRAWKKLMTYRMPERVK
jgi:hypothetical protein